MQALGLRVGTSMCDALRYRARLSSRAASAASIGELRRRARSRTGWNRRKAEKMGNGLRKARSSGVTSFVEYNCQILPHVLSNDQLFGDSPVMTSLVRSIWTASALVSGLPR